MQIRNESNIRVGDVIRSPRFEFGAWRSCSVKATEGPISVGYGEPFRCTSYEYVDVALPNGQTQRTTVTADPLKFDRSDSTRPQASFVVVSTQMQGGGYIRANDYHPDGLYVKAQRLTPDGKFDPSGELIGFYMSDDFCQTILEVELVGTRKV